MFTIQPGTVTYKNEASFKSLGVGQGPSVLQHWPLTSLSSSVSSSAGALNVNFTVLPDFGVRLVTDTDVVAVAVDDVTVITSGVDLKGLSLARLRFKMVFVDKRSGILMTKQKPDYFTMNFIFNAKMLNLLRPDTVWEMARPVTIMLQLICYE